MKKCFSPSGCDERLGWVSEKGISIKGYLYVNDVLVSGSDLFDVLGNVDSRLSFLSLLANLNGFFAIIVECDDFIYAAVDRVNSTPLMYKIDDDLWIGDNYSNFIRKTSRINQESLVQYLSSGYVYEDNTLIDDVFQLLPGTALIYDKKQLTGMVEKYYEYLPETCRPIHHSESDYINMLDDVHNKVFGRLVENLNGRQAVLPLSGGYDSRLILEMLLRFGHKNILCVTWGRENDWQAKIARNVTFNLGINWVCINQDSGSWSKWYRKHGVEDQLERCGALCSIPYIQENVLIEYLAKNKLIDSDAIFLNGNSGDFIEGEHIPPGIKAEIENDEIVARLVYKHQRLAKVSNPEKTYKLLGDSVQSFRERGLDARLFFEYWEWSERQSKFVTNCIKPFEAGGYEWRMPFWENEVMDFWANVPIDIKSERKLFYSYFKLYMNTKVQKPNPAVPRIKILYERFTDQRFGIFFDNLYGFGRFLKSTSKKYPNLFEGNKNLKSKSLTTVKLNSLLAFHVVSNIQKDILSASNDVD